LFSRSDSPDLVAVTFPPRHLSTPLSPFHPGINLLKLYDLIMQHRMSWVMKADRPFAEPDSKAVLITSIQIEEIEREVG